LSASTHKLRTVLALVVALHGCASNYGPRLSECELSHVISEKAPPLVLLIDLEDSVRNATQSPAEAAGQVLLESAAQIVGSLGLLIVFSPAVIPGVAIAASTAESCKLPWDTMAGEAAKWVRSNSTFLEEAVRSTLVHRGLGSVTVITIPTNNRTTELNKDDEQKLAEISFQLGATTLMTARIKLIFFAYPQQSKKIGGCGPTKIYAEALMEAQDRSTVGTPQSLGHVWVWTESNKYEPTDQELADVNPEISQVMVQRALDSLAEKITSLYLRCHP